MTLNELQDAIVSTLATALGSTITVSACDGEYSADSIRRYASAAPAVHVAITGFDSDKTIISGEATAEVKPVLFLTTKRTPLVSPGRGVQILATSVLRSISEVGQVWGLNDPAQAPRNIKGKNLYASDLDKMQVALWAISWSQLVDLVSGDESYDDLELLHADYDLAEPDGTYEATDEIDLTE